MAGQIRDAQPGRHAKFTILFLVKQPSNSIGHHFAATAKQQQVFLLIDEQRDFFGHQRRAGEHGKHQVLFELAFFFAPHFALFFIKNSRDFFGKGGVDRCGRQGAAGDVHRHHAPPVAQRENQLFAERPAHKTSAATRLADGFLPLALFGHRFKVAMGGDAQEARHGDKRLSHGRHPCNSARRPPAMRQRSCARERSGCHHQKCPSPKS